MSVGIIAKFTAIQQWLSGKKRAYLAARPHRSFKPTKTPRKHPPLVGVKKNVLDTFITIKQERKLLYTLGLIYAVATYLFVGGVAQADFVGLREATLEVFGGTFSSAGTAFSLLTSTMSGAFNASLTELQQFLAVLIAVLFWLTIVWALRMRFAGNTIKARDALYSAGAPLVAYVTVAFVIVLQLTPGALGLFILNLAQSGGWLHGGVEVMMFAVGAFLLCCLSAYWLSGSLLSLVVVTLPQMYPWRALSISSELVIRRRLRILGHAAALVVVLFAIWVVVLLPVLLIDGWLHIDWIPLIPIAVQLLSAYTLIYFSTYVYKLYRSLI